MILKLAKKQSLVVLIILPILVFAFFFSGAIYSVPTDSLSGPLMRYLIVFLPQNSWLNPLLASALILLQALTLNRVLNKAELYSKRSFIPALLFVIISCSYVSFRSFNSVMIANFFMILVLSRSFKMYGEGNISSNVFDAGFFLGMAALFNLSYVAFLPLISVFIIVLKTPNWREPIISVLGFLSPIVFWVVFGLYTDYDFDSLKVIISNNNFLDFFSGQKSYLTPSGGMFMLIWFFSGFMYFGYYREKNTKGRKSEAIWRALFSFCCGVTLLAFYANPGLDIFLILAIPVSICFSYLFLFNKRRIVDIVLLLWIILLLFELKILELIGVDKIF